MEGLVSELIETDVVVVRPERSLKAAGTKLHEHDIGSLIVQSEDQISIGILTSDDILQAIADSNRTLSEIPTREYMSRPILTTDPDSPVRSAVRKMNHEEVEQLAIIEEYEVTGILSETDVIRAYDSLIKAAHEAERQRDD